MMSTLISHFGSGVEIDGLVRPGRRRTGRFGLLGVLSLACAVLPVRAESSGQAVKMDRAGRLVYAQDAQGNRVPDFSAAGYGGGGRALPVVPARVVVTPRPGGDDGARIQAAIDYVSGLPLDAAGFRGAVFLPAGRYHLAGGLRIRASGVVLRGAGDGETGTVLEADGTGRRTLIDIRGTDDRRWTTDAIPVTDSYVPVGATRLRVADARRFKAGDRVMVERPSPEAWIASIGMDKSPASSPFMWRPGTMDITWDRVVTAVDGNELTLNAPITTALEARFGGGTVRGYDWPGRLHHVGVEQLRCESTYDAGNPKDEAHSWMAVQLDDVADAWVADVTGVHFVSSLVDIASGGLRITVQDCSSLAPVSEMGGYRRHTFHTAGQLTLFLRDRAEDGLCDFTTGYLAAGPNVFLHCTAIRSHDVSGSIGSWASGILFDNVNIDGGALALDNLEIRDQGVGWAAANSVLWQSEASRLVCRTPPGATNWAIGVWGEFWGDGRWQRDNEFVNPQSLYEAQLTARLGPSALTALTPRAIPDDAAGAPPVETVVPAPAAGVPAAPARPLALKNGWLVDPAGLLTGGLTEINWWRGQLLPARRAEYGPNLTRFVPGRTGPGATDDLAQVVATMQRDNQVVLRHHRGLWYNQRSDDHEMVRRFNGDVWPPFYEQPWARSGRGTAWDGLSRYDLTKFNPWYFHRLREFAELGREHGVVLIDAMYFQHNVLEAGAHWASFPWRPANCVQDTGFPEPPVYFDHKRNFMAPIFYDVTNPVRREIHQLLIRHYLDSLAGEPNVIHVTGEEFTGPLSFMQFWFDTVGAWERETGRHPLIGLSAPKNVQDGILADPQRAPLVDVIDLKYWWESKKGLYAPPGGKNLSPRQSERKWRGGRPDAANIAHMVREYRERFPQKAVICQLHEAEGWSLLAAGGSFPALPRTLDPGLRAALPEMRPIASPAGVAKAQWALGATGRGYFVYALPGHPVRLDLSADTGRYTAHRIDLATGRPEPEPETVSAGGMVTLAPASRHPLAFWLTR